MHNDAVARPVETRAVEVMWWTAGADSIARAAPLIRCVAHCLQWPFAECRLCLC